MAHIAMSTGWTWDHILENVDLPRLDAMNRYWEYQPPVHVSFARHLGIKPPEPITEKSQLDGLSELVSMTLPKQ